MYSPAAVVTALGGVARRDQILDAGLSGSDITAAVRRGELRRVRRAHYATATASPDAVAAVRVGGRLGGLSAARTYGAWGGFDVRVHVVVAPNAARLRVIRDREGTTPDVGDRQVVLHWVDAEAGRECWRVPLLDALRQVARWADAETAMATLDTALDLRLISVEMLARAFADEPATSRARSRAARPGSGSGYESIAVRRLRRLGLRVRQQVFVPGVGRVDGEVEDHLLLEIDGGHHETVEAREVDRRRDAAAAALGRPVIRLSTRRIREDWEGCVADILGVLRHRP
jgi:very-short-patch-repair endonuclease